jgi:hypothetical protein
LVSWSESNESATAQLAPPGQPFGRSGRPGAHAADDAAPALLGPLPGRLLAHFFSILVRDR